MILWLLACGPKGERAAPAAESVTAPFAWEVGPSSGDNVYLAVMAKAGSRYDPPGKAGLAALTASAMVDGGAGPRSPAEVQQALRPTANRIEVVVDRDLVTFRLRCHRDHADLCLEVLGDVVAAPRFAETSVEELRQGTTAYLSHGLLGDEEALGAEALPTLVFAGHPYGHPVDGLVDEVDTLAPDDLRAFHARHYTRPDLLLGVAGPVTDEQRERWATRLGALPATSPGRAELPVPSQPHGRELVVIETAGDVTGFHLGHTHDVGRAHPDWLALKVGITIFGLHRERSGRLFDALRNRRGLNYGTYAYAEPFAERRENKQPENGLVRAHNHFSLWIRPTTIENGPFALRLALAELERLVEHGVTEEELARTTKSLALVTPLEALDPGRQLAYAMDARITGTPNPLTWVPEQLPTLTLEQVNQALARHLRPAQLWIVAVTGDADDLVERTGPESITPVVYTDVTPDSAQAERDAEVAALPLQLGGVRRLEAGAPFRSER